MTRQEILEATPDQLDAMVAEMMGWKLGPSTSCTIWWEDASGRKTYDVDKYHPSRDMSQVRAALRATPAKWWIIDRRLGPTIPPEEIVKVTLPPMYPIQAPCQMTGPTEEIAICRAILLATLSEVERKEKL